jgi:general secretion pathway protein K
MISERSRLGIESEAGFALVAVLLVVAVLSVIAVSMLSSGQIAARLARSSSRHASETAVLDAGISRALLGIMDKRPDHRWRADGVPQTISIFRTQIAISVQDELGKIDLNAADADLFKGLFRSVGLDTRNAGVIVDRILDWRSPSDLRHLNGLSTEDYSSIGAVYRPRHAGFQRIDELLLVPGMTPELYERVAPALTVYSGRPLFDPQIAPREALLALSNMDSAQVDRLLQARHAVALSINQTQQMSSADLVGQAFTVEDTVANLDGGGAREVEVVRFTGDPQNPYWVLFRVVS